MANKNYNETKKAQAAGNGSYECEHGPSSERDTTGAFGTRPEVNDMSGTGAATTYQAKYDLPKDNWRSK